jgi:signal transduction histidine kinase
VEFDVQDDEKDSQEAEPEHIFNYLYALAITASERLLAVTTLLLVAPAVVVNDLACRLHASLIEHVGLEVAMRDHVAEITKRTGLPVMFTAREVPVAISPEMTTNLFRVMQENLQNVFKHARATDVTVGL